MNQKTLLLGLSAIRCGLAVRYLSSSKNQPMPTIPQSNPYKEIDEFIEDQRHHLSIPGISLAIVEGDNIVHFHGFGQARPGGEAPTSQTPFFIGSITKSITALAIMQLFEDGKIELDAPVQRYLPWFRVLDPDASTKMKVRHLLNHTSGLSAMQGQMILSDMKEGTDATEMQVRKMANLKLSHQVGSKFVYNNTNYNILGLIIEVASGESYADYVQSHIFAPLEMKHSYISRDIARLNGLAMGHRYWFGHPFPAPNLRIPRGSLPSGQLISCAEDMVHYLIAQLNGGRYTDRQVLSSAGIDEMHRGTAEINEMGLSLGSYAMGWERQTVGHADIVFHSGIVPDFGGFVSLIPEQKRGLVLLYNANHAMMKLTFDELGLNAVKLLAGETPSKTVLAGAPWLMRGMALIPILQAASVVITLRQVRHWKTDPSSRPTDMKLWYRHILPPLGFNMLTSLLLVPMLSKMRGWVKLFMPDYAWIATISGGFAAIWTILRTGLILRILNQSDD